MLSLFLAFILGAALLIFVSLVRTEAGRDVIRSELESWFAESYYGRLSIGSATGNLQQDVILSNVRLYDAQDRLWLQIDTVIARPRWLLLLRRHMEVHSLQITRPTLYAAYQADSSWNFIQAVQRRTPRKAPWHLQTTRVSIVDGRIETRREAHQPSRVRHGWLFDVTASAANEINLDMEFQWRPNLRLIDVQSFSAELPDQNLAIDQLSAEVLQEAGRWHINELELTSGVNHFSLVGVHDIAEGTVSLGLQNNIITPQFAAIIFPGLTLPDTLQFSGRVLSDSMQLNFDDWVIGSGLSAVVTSGSLDLTPDPRSFELRVLDGSVSGQDLTRLIASDRPAPDIMGITAVANGQILDSELTATTTYDLELSNGHLSGETDITRNKEWIFETTLTGQSVDLELFHLGSPWFGSVNGKALLSVTGWPASELSLTLNLSPSDVSGIFLDTLSVAATYAGQQVAVNGFAAGDQGHLSVEGDIDLSSHLPAYTFSGETRALDLSVVRATAPIHSALQTRWTLNGTGRTWDELSGSIAILADSSKIVWDESEHIIEPHTWTIQVADPMASAPRIRVGGDVLSLEARGALPADVVRAIGKTWLTNFRNAIEQQANNVRARADISGPERTLAWPSLDQLILGSSAKRALERSSVEALNLECDWIIRRPDILGGFLPMLPAIRSSMYGDLSVRANAERFSLAATISDSLFSAGPVALHEVNATLDMEANLLAPLEETLQIEAEGYANLLTGIGRTIASPKITLSQNGRTGAVLAIIDEYEGTGPGRLTAELQLLNDRSRIAIADSWIVLGGFPWRTSTSASIDFFSDAVVFPPIVLESPAPAAGRLQRLAISGALSSAPTDTLHVRLDNLALGRLSEILQLRRTLQGDLNAQLHWTGLTQPEITGRVHVDTLSLENRVIGRLQANSHLLPNTASLRVLTTVQPLGIAPRDMEYTENDLSLSGTVSLPSAVRPGSLNLALDVQRADAGFLEELLLDLDDTTGGFSGQGTISGTFSYPVIEAALAIESASFSMPKYNTSYRASASLRVDRNGIQVDDLQLSDATGGRARLNGRLPFNDYRYLSFDVNGHLDALQIINAQTFSRELPFYGDIRVTGDLSLNGPVSSAFLKADNLITTPQSELLIPIRKSAEESDPGFIIYADSSRSLTEQIAAVRQRDHLLMRRPEGERNFAGGLDLDLNIYGPPGSTIRLVIDPLLGDVINGMGSARIQLQRLEDEFLTYGTFDITSGDYLFTAGEVFVRRFLINEGTITWTGDPPNPILDIRADYRTRASRSGLPENAGGALKTSLPLIVNLHITGELNAVNVDLSLALDQRREAISDTPLLESYLNQPDLAAEHATSVLLTNSFLLSAEGARSVPLGGSAFNSVSSLVSSQLNRYLSQVIPNADFTLGVQSDETAADLDLSAGIALRLLDERLVIRSQGVYRGLSTQEQPAATQGLEGEFIVEIRLNPSVAIEVFYRREGDVLSETLITSETGLGVNYRTEFATWRRLWRRIFGSGRDDTITQNTKRAQSK